MTTILLVIVSFILGYYLNWLERSLQRLGAEIKRITTNALSKDNKDNTEQNKSSFFDPEDPVQKVKWEQEEMHRRLNPHLYDDEQL